MSKTAINNEIVLMRQAVRKSRVSVIRKLIKEAKLLNARKHGDEKNVEKCKRKAKRLVAEIEASKKIKDDDITKYGITEGKCLQEILSDNVTEPCKRIMARFAHNKFLRDRIIKFRKTFPSYEEFLGPGRKKMSKLQRRGNREARNRMKFNGETTKRSDSKVQRDNVDEHVSDEDADDTKDSNSKDESEGSEACENIEVNKINDEPSQDSSFKEEPEPKSIRRLTTSKKTKNAQSDVRARPKRREVPTYSFAKAKKHVSIKVISEEATVERFSELTERNESSEIVERINGKKMMKGLTIEKQVDAFFMTENGECEYMSVVVPKLENCGDDDQGDQYRRNHGTKRQKTFHEKNKKFFNKIDQPSKNDCANKFGRNDDRTMERFARSSKAANVDKFRNVNGGFEKKNDVKEEELHPSWQARKKQQEILKQGFQGKKIVFDD